MPSLWPPQEKGVGHVWFRWCSYGNGIKLGSMFWNRWCSDSIDHVPNGKAAVLIILFFSLPCVLSWSLLAVSQCIHSESIPCTYLFLELAHGSPHSNPLIQLLVAPRHMNTNPRQGPFHFRSPAKILWRFLAGHHGGSNPIPPFFSTAP